MARLLKTLTFIVLLTGPAAPHDALPTAEQPTGWSYPFSCCSGIDCRAMTVAESRAIEMKGGYQIPETGEIVPYGDRRIKDSPYGLFHWCSHQAGENKGKTICLFVPPRGF